MEHFENANNNFASPQEELAYLRERVAAKERELEVPESRFERERIATREVEHYADAPSTDVLKPQYAMSEHEVAHSALRLAPEEHDTQIDELLRVVSERGIKNALAIAKKINSAHLEDDLHRALVRYVAEGLPSGGSAPSGEVWRALHMTLYEIALPQHAGGEAEQLTRLLGSMEQFYAGLLDITGGSKGAWSNNVFTLELASRVGSEEVTLYASVPHGKGELFEKHLLSIFPDALVEECRNDYNIFTYGGAHAASFGTLSRSFAYPLKTYQEFAHDPLGVILSSFSRLSKHNEGAAIQFVIGERGEYYNQKLSKMQSDIAGGMSVSKAEKYAHSNTARTVDLFSGALFGGNGESTKERTIDQNALELIRKKAAKRIVPVTVRIVASAESTTRAEDIVSGIASSFNQFEEARGNRIIFKQARRGVLRRLLHDFSFRLFNRAHALPLSLEELASMCQIATSASASRELKQNRAKRAAAPLEVAPEEHAHADIDGVVLGVNNHGGRRTEVFFKAEDRLRHFYEIGQTGTGKTHLMKNMIIQDIENGEGCCYIDPHGADVLDILASIPKHRYEDVIYFDPSDITRPMGLNMLEYDPARPEQKTFVVNEMVSIFEKLYGDVPEALGPNFQQYFRNAALLVVESPELGSTLLDITRVLSDSAFRRKKLAACNNPLVVQFWRDIAEKAGGEASLENIVPYISSKTDVFLANDIMRPIVAQQESAFNFQKIMDERKILLVNLSKGRLGETNANLLGLIIVGKFLQAALSRDIAAHHLPPFYLYIDEFQNITTPSIATILSEARKYKLSLNIAHQFIAQLEANIRDAVFGNVGTKCVFRVGTEDAEFLAKSFEPEFSASDIAGLDNRHAYLSLLVDGRPVRPFDIETLAGAQADRAVAEALKQRSSERYGRPREAVEAAIAEKYRKEPPQMPDFSALRAQGGNM